MENKIATQVKRHKLLLVFLAGALVKQLLVAGLPICAICESPCDDQLMKDWAFSMAALDWTGDFNVYTFMKEPGFSFFLAVCYRLHIPYIFAVNTGFSIACMFFCTALRKAFTSDVPAAIIYVVLLFHPVSFCMDVLQRVYRNGFSMVLTLFVFAGLLHMYFSVCEEKMRGLLLWSAFTGLSLGYLWVTKKDTIWLLPFTGVICAVMFGILLAKKRGMGSVRGILCLTLPFLGIFLFSQGVKYCNISRYGIPSLEYYGAFMDDITHIKSGQGGERVRLTRRQLRELYDLSPTLASVSGTLESVMDLYAEYGTRPDNDEVEEGWLGWAVLNGLSRAGVYESSEKAEVFYKNAHQELEEVFADGRLERIEVTAAQKYHLDTPQRRRELISRMGECIGYMASFEEAFVRVFPDKSWGRESQEFEEITRTKAAYGSVEHDYYIRGWLLLQQYRGEALDIYVEDSEGNQYEKLELQESNDIYEYLDETGEASEEAKKCRFQAVWDVEESKRQGETWYLAVYSKGKRLGQIQLSEEGYREAGIPFRGSLDTYISKSDRESLGAARKRIADRLNFIGDLYRAGGMAAMGFGMISYVFLTGVVILDLRKKKFTHGNAWLISTGLGLSILVFAAGIAVVDLTQCPAVSVMYLSSGYAVMIAAGLVSICKCGELAVGLAKQRKPESS